MKLLFLLFPALLAAQSALPPVEGTPKTLATLRYVDTQLGSGDLAAAGQEYTVHYTGYLTNGEKFDSSVDRKEPFTFVQGKRQVISGWDMGFEGMRVGGKRRLYIPHQMAYGEKGTGPIPPKAELIFDVELLGVKTLPETPASLDVLQPYDDLTGKVLALLSAVPEDKLDFRPAPGTRTFRQVFHHIALGNTLLYTMVEIKPPKENIVQLIQSNAAEEQKPVTKEQLRAALESSFKTLRTTLASLRNGQLGQSADFFGRATTTRGIYVLVDTHLAEHLGQAVAYARMNGITPPWSK